MTPESKRDLTGKKLRNYLIERLVGKGGMGVVYEAYEENLDRKVAIKVLPAHLSEDESFTGRFLREARSAAKLEHPGICPIYAAGQVEGIYFIAMQFVDGESLGDILERFGNLPVEQALLITRRVADALNFAHSRGFVHRDIKPDNIMIDRGGRVKVMDFGLARTTALESRMTQTGMYVGTPEYSSPEQCETLDLDGRSDLYSLGVVLYEMLSGTVPYRAETPYALFTKICNEQPAPIRELNPQVPESVAKIVDRMLAKDREERYQSAGELIVSIDATLRTLNIDSTADTAALPVPGLSSYTTEKLDERAEAATMRVAYRKKKSLAPVIAVVIALAVIGLWLAVAMSSRDKRTNGKMAGAPVVQPEPEPVTPGPVTPEPVEPKEVDPEPVKQTIIDRPQPPKPMTGPEEGLPIATLLVCDFANRNKNTEIEWMKIGVAEMFITDLAQCKFLRVISREEFTRLLRRLGLKQEQAPDNLDRLTGELGAQMILKGNVVKIGRTIRIDILLLDAASGRILLTKTELDQEENFLSTIDVLSSALRVNIAEVVRKNHPDAPAEIFAGAGDLSLEEQIFLADTGMDLKELRRARKEPLAKRQAVPAKPQAPEKRYGKGAAADKIGKLAPDAQKAEKENAEPSKEAEKNLGETRKLKDGREKAKTARKEEGAAPSPGAAVPEADQGKSGELPGAEKKEESEGAGRPLSGATGGRGHGQNKAEQEQKPGSPRDPSKKTPDWGAKGVAKKKAEPATFGEEEEEDKAEEAKKADEDAPVESGSERGSKELTPARRNYLALRAYYRALRKLEGKEVTVRLLQEVSEDLMECLRQNPNFKLAQDKIKELQEKIKKGK
jgi:TolB-like protein/predicted Ser/Thr protein kinase